MSTEEPLGQQSGPDFGDLLDAYDLHNEDTGQKEDGEAQNNAGLDAGKTPPHVAKMQREDMPAKTPALGTEQSHGDMPSHAKETVVIQPSNPGVFPTSVPATESLSVNICEESSLQTLSRFVEELSSPRKDDGGAPGVTKGHLPMSDVSHPVNLLPAITTQPSDVNVDLSSKENSLSHPDGGLQSSSSLVVNQRDNLSAIKKNNVVNRTEDLPAVTLQNSVIDNSASNKYTNTNINISLIAEAVSSINSVVDVNKTIDIASVSNTKPNVSTTSSTRDLSNVTSDIQQGDPSTEENVKDTTSNKNINCRDITAGGLSQSNFDTVSGANESATRSVQTNNQNGNSSVTQISCSTVITEQFTTNISSNGTQAGNSITENKTVEDNTSSKVTQGSVSGNSDSSCLNDAKKPTDSVQTTMVQQSQDGSTRDNLVTVSVGDDGRETFHCMDEDTDQIISFHIENVPDADTSDDEVNQYDSNECVGVQDSLSQKEAVDSVVEKGSMSQDKGANTAGKEKEASSESLNSPRNSSNSGENASQIAKETVKYGNDKVSSSDEKEHHSTNLNTEKFDLNIEKVDAGKQDINKNCHKATNSEEPSASEDIVSIKCTTASEDIVSSKSTTASEDIVSSKSTTASEDIVSSKSTTASEDIVSSKSTTASEDIVSSKSTIGSEDIVSSNSTTASEDIVSSKSTTASEDIVSSKSTTTLEATPVLLQCLTGNNRKAASNSSTDVVVSESSVNVIDRRKSIENLSRRSSVSSEINERSSTHFEPLNLSVQSSPSSSTGCDTSGRERPGSSMSMPSPKSVHSVQSSNPSPVNVLNNTSPNNNKDSATGSTKSGSSVGRINKRKRKDPVRSQNYNYISSLLEQSQTPASSEQPLAMAPLSINPKPAHVKEERTDKSYDKFIHNITPEESIPVQPRISNVQSLNSAMSNQFSQFSIHNQYKPIQPPSAKNSRSRSKSKQKTDQLLLQQQEQQRLLQTQQQQQQQPHQQQPIHAPPGPMTYLGPGGIYNSPLDGPNIRHPMRPMNYQPIQPINIAPEGPLPPPLPSVQGFTPRYFPPPPPSGNPRMPPHPYNMQPPPPPYNSYSAIRQAANRPYFYDQFPYSRSYRPTPPPAPPQQQAPSPVSTCGSVVVHHPPHRAPFINIRPDHIPANLQYQPPQQAPLIQSNRNNPGFRKIVPSNDNMSGITVSNNMYTPNSTNNTQQNNRAIIVSPNDTDHRYATSARSNTTTRPRIGLQQSKTIESTKVTSSVIANTPKSTTVKQLLPKTTVAAKLVTAQPKVSVAKSSTSSIGAAKSLLASITIEQSEADRISSEILKEQPIATYKPAQPPASLGFKEPLKTYKCQGCGDEFLFSTSLVNHLERKTTFINYSCEECHKVIAFYNRCCLFIHAKSHAKGARAYRLNINLAYIKVLPEAFMPKVDKSHVQAVGEQSAKSADKENNVKAVSPKVTVQSDKTATKEIISPRPVTKTLIEPNKAPAIVISQKLHLNNYNPNFYTVLTAKNKRMYKCLECKKVYYSLQMYINHFNGKTAKTPGLFKCSKCLTDVVGVCASSAHMRVHSKEKPYVCPECGEHISGTRDIFLKHLKQKCVHFQRTLLMRCTICNSVVLFDPDTVAKHYMESHYSKYYKCLVCPMAFKTEETFLVHKKSVHQGKGESKLICKCALCDTVFHQLDSVQDHFKSEHWPEMSKHTCFTAFKCTHCTPQKLFNNRNAYSYHVTRIHSAHIIEEMCNVCGAEFNTEIAMKLHRKRMHNDFVMLANTPLEQDDPADSNNEDVDVDSNEVVQTSSTKANSVSNNKITPPKVHECNRCNTLFRDEVTYNKHMAKHRFVQKRKLMGTKVPSLKIKKLKVEDLDNSHSFKIVSPEPDKEASNGTDAVEADADKRRKNKVFVSQVPTAPLPKAKHKCSECEEKFFTIDDVQEHLKMSHGITPQFPCHLCGNTYDSQEMTERHIQLVHEGKSKDHPYLCWLCLENSNQIKGYGSWKMLEKHLTGHHKLHKNNIDYSKFPKFGNNGDVDSDSVASKRSDTDLDDNPVKRLKLAGDATFSCAKCKYQGDDRADFMNHIIRHKLDENDIQCLECGLCFAVLPSLKRHLFMVHKIRDFKKYQLESGVDVESMVYGTVDGNNVKQSPLKTHISQIPNGIAQPNLERLEKKKEPKKNPDVDEDNPLECNVCYKIFESDAALRKHMRMHGMAFIRSRRAQVPVWD